MSWSSRWRAQRRQRRHHWPFRIAEPEWDAGARVRLGRLVEELASAAPPASDTGGSAAVLGEGKLCEAATYLFRARRRVPHLNGADAREAKRVGRYLRSTEEELKEAGLLIQDHTGDDYHPGMSVEVVAFQDVPGLDREVIWETLRPSVYLARRRIQMAQVIVGRPGPDDPTTTEDPRA